MDQENRIYTSKGVNIQHYYGNHGNIMHSNHDNNPAKSLSLTQPENYFKFFEKHRVKGHLFTLLLSMVETKSEEKMKKKVSQFGT